MFERYNSAAARIMLIGEQVSRRQTINVSLKRESESGSIGSGGGLREKPIQSQPSVDCGKRNERHQNRD
jgi:hypothetical protein